MKGYLSIGKVSKLKNVSIKSLRYYDQIGVLRPAYINEKTNYRYYTEDQLYLLDAISLCIELGIPLSRFSDYLDESGTLNIQKLLFDGKDMAEKKIRQMRSCIDQLQQTLQRLEAEPVKKTLPTAALPQRYVMVAEFDEVTTANRYNHMLLSLFVNAEKQGHSAGYPTGLLYEYEKGVCTKYVFATIEGTDIKPSGQIRLLPAGEYYTSRSKEHRIEEGNEIFSTVLSQETSDHYLLIETDVMEEGQKGTKELQLITS
ncbi:MAG: helix-turn-helix domain-containing protein [Lachnospiraceae bacterium]|nr:helix-turn-helix domain-containing protein [Lachnospiraceae bacterium]